MAFGSLTSLIFYLKVLVEFDTFSISLLFITTSQFIADVKKYSANYLPVPVIITLIKRNPSLQLGDVNIRLEQIEPKVCSSDGLVCHTSPDGVDLVKVNQAESSSMTKSSVKEISVSGGQHAYSLAQTQCYNMMQC